MGTKTMPPAKLLVMLVPLLDGLLVSSASASAFALVLAASSVLPAVLLLLVMVMITIKRWEMLLSLITTTEDTVEVVVTPSSSLITTTEDTEEAVATPSSSLITTTEEATVVAITSLLLRTTMEEAMVDTDWYSKLHIFSYLKTAFSYKK